MPTDSFTRWLATCAVAAACAPAAKTAPIPPAPIVFHWPDPSFLPDRQCHGGYDPAALER